MIGNGGACRLLRKPQKLFPCYREHLQELEAVGIFVHLKVQFPMQCIKLSVGLLQLDVSSQDIHLFSRTLMLTVGVKGDGMR